MTNPDNAVSAIRPEMVNPLIWSENEPNSWSAIACGFPFTYQIRLTDSGRIRTRTGSMEWGYFSGSLDEAKAAAQADYAARIASALDPAFIERMGVMEAENAALRNMIIPAYVEGYADAETKYLNNLPADFARRAYEKSGAKRSIETLSKTMEDGDV